MKRAIGIALILMLLVMPFAAQAISLSDIGDKPEPAPRTMPEPTVVNIPKYSSKTTTFLGKIVFPNGSNGIGYEFGPFSSDSWEQTQALIKYNNRLIEAGYKAPNIDKFEGDNMQYLCFTASGKPGVYVFPFLKENALIIVIKYNDDILGAFPEDVKAEDAYAALVAELDSEETRNQAAGKLAAIWKTSDMTQAVKGKITAETLDELLPALIRKDFFTKFSDNGEVNVSSSVTEIGKVLQGIIGSMESEEARLSFAKRVASGGILSAVDERYLEVSSLVWNSDSDMQSGEVTELLPAIPAFNSEEKIPGDLSDDGAAHKYVVVSEKEGKYRLLPYHAMFLPVDEIAESLGEADRIIVCHNYYEKSSGNWIGGRPSDSLTQISLYNAADGAFICSIGRAGSYQGMVSHGGLPFDWSEIGEVIGKYFAEK